MNRRGFFKKGSLLALGSTVMNPLGSMAQHREEIKGSKGKKAKNIIFLVSDGMSAGTLSMSDLYLYRKTGKGSNWLQLYKEHKVTRALMDTASLSSIVTDSAAASSSWGGGFRVNNGMLNVGPNDEQYLPIWQKFKKSGKMAGCVTTVPITHATPAGFCVNSKSRNAQEDIAGMYLTLNLDVMMGGGNDYFDVKKRKDQKDMYVEYQKAGYQIVKTRQEMLHADSGKPILGVFCDNGLPYSIDRNHDPELLSNIPSLAEMTQKAIDCMKTHKDGFVLQVEGGKVDWAAHGNDIAGLLYDQIAFDEAIKIAVDFAEKEGNTLVIITTDHGNANPGIIYGHYANDHFDTIRNYKHTNDWILNGIDDTTSISQVRERIEFANGGNVISEEEAGNLLMYYEKIRKEEGLYNPKQLPYKVLAEIQKKTNAVGWISMDHSADYVELAMYGSGSDLLKPFIKNIDLHDIMLQAAGIENKF